MNHLWILRYFGGYFRQHHELPFVLNSSLGVGSPFPVFYGFLFYRIFGSLSGYLSIDLFFRLSVLGLSWVLATLIFGVLKKITSISSALAITAITAWAIYPMTNLYDRSSITEYFATHFLLCSACAWLRLTFEEDRLRQCLWILISGMFAILMLGTHPITAEYGLLSLLVLMALTARSLRLSKALAATALLIMIAALVILSPWLYALHRFSHSINIVRYLVNVVGIVGSDTLSNRLMPIPHRVNMGSQMNIPLFIAFAALFVQCILRKKSIPRENWVPILSSLGLSVFLIWISVNWRVFEYLPKPLRMIQLVFRLVTYQNLFLFLGVFFSLRALRSTLSAWQKPVFAVALVISFTGVGIKQMRAWEGFQPDPSRELISFQGPLSVGVPAELSGDYNTPGLYREIEQPSQKPVRVATLEIGSGPQFGIVLPKAIDADQPIWLKVPVSPFPWNTFVLDGKEIAHSDLVLIDAGLGVPIPAGKHLLEFRAKPDRTWRRLMRFSDAFLWVLLLCALGGACHLIFHPESENGVQSTGHRKQSLT